MSERVVNQAPEGGLEPVWDAARVGKPYRPSNGSEGMVFEEAWCFLCRYFVTKRNEDYDDCTRGILVRAHGFEPDEKGYPKQWRYDDRGRPICSAFRARANRVSSHVERAKYEQAMRGVV